MFKYFDGLELKKSEGCEGRYIAAARDIDLGEDILRCESYFSITCEDYKKSTCHNCIKIIKNPPQSPTIQSVTTQSTTTTITPIEPIKCNQCNEVWYCNEQCKKNNQAKHYHYECIFYKNMKAPKLTNQKFDFDAFSEIRIIVGLLSRYYKDKILNNKPIEQPESEQQEDLSNYHLKDTLDDVMGLIENDINEQSNNAAKELIDQLYSYIINLLKLVIITLSPSVDTEDQVENEIIVSKLILIIKPLIHKVRCNQFGVWSKTDKCLGMLVSPSSSYFNHSCLPNCESIRDGCKMTFKSLYPIKKGEQITITYLNPDDSSPVRLNYLKYGYYFDCGCPRCSSHINGNKELEESLDGWISKFYCSQKKCSGLYCSKLKLNNRNIADQKEIILICSNCKHQKIVSNTYFNNKPNF